VVGDAERLPFADGSLDLVAQISVPVFFDEVSRVLAPRGYVVVVSSLGHKTPFHTPERTRRGPGAVPAFSASQGAAPSRGDARSASIAREPATWRLSFRVSDDQQGHAEPRERRVPGSAKQGCERFGLRRERRAVNDHRAV